MCLKGSQIVSNFLKSFKVFQNVLKVFQSNIEVFHISKLLRVFQKYLKASQSVSKCLIVSQSGNTSHM